MGIDGVDDGRRLAGPYKARHFHGTEACHGGQGCGADHLTGAAREAVIPVTLLGRLQKLEMQLSAEALNVRALSQVVGMLIRDVRSGGV